MHLQSSWANWNLLVSFLHQHKQFTKLTHATTFPATQTVKTQAKSVMFSSVFLKFKLFPTHSFQPEHSAVQTTSLWTRTPVDLNYDHNSQQLKVSSDNAGFLLLSRTSQRKNFHVFFWITFPTKQSSKIFLLLWNFLSCFNYKKQAPVYWIHSPVWALLSRCSHPPLTIFSLPP